jgi:hypothetical protein
MYHTVLKIGLFGLVFASLGCLRVGLPEHIAEIPVSPAPQPVNTILINPTESAANRSIGNQFVFLLFPLSRVYLEHGFRRLAAEIITEELSARGLIVVETDSVKNGLELYRSIPSITRVVLLRRADTSASVLDLFFSRRVVVDGVIELSLLSPDSGDIIANDALAISAGEFRATAFGPGITSLLERETRKAISDTTVLGLEPPRRKPDHEGQNKPTCLIPPPVLPTSLSPQLGAATALSYGFKRTGAFNPAQLARLIQRGAVRELNKMAIACGMTSGEEGNFASNADRLVLSFEKIELSGDSGLISARVRSNASNVTAPLEIPVRTNVDGAVAWALEELGERSILALNLGLTSK